MPAKRAPPLAPPSRNKAPVLKGGVSKAVGSAGGALTHDVTIGHGDWRDGDTAAADEAAALDAMLNGDLDDDYDPAERASPPKAAAPKRSAAPNPRDLAAKYGVDMDADFDDFDDDDSNDGGPAPTSDHGGSPPRGGGAPQPPPQQQPTGDGAKFEGQFDWGNAGFAQVGELVQQNELLRADANCKAGQLKKLGMLLEALEPLPGLDPDKLLDVMEGAKDEHEIDYRDAKIVHLAKKSRHLAVALESEKARTKKLAATEADLKRDVETLTTQLDLVASPAARAAAVKSGGGGGATNANPLRKAAAPTDDGDGPRATKQEAALGKQCAELRGKLQQAEGDLKRATAALKKEVGDDAASVEKVLEEGWRGRAQQIVMLKSRIRQLEQSAPEDRKPLHKRHDVDAKAREEIQDMERERQRAVEQLSSDFEAVKEELDLSKKKMEAARARTRVIENENVKRGEQMKTLIEKGDTDNDLIDALRAELQNVRLQAQAKGRARDAERTMEATRELAGANRADAAPDSELAQLRRENKRQQDQLERQEGMLRELRTELTKARRGGGGGGGGPPAF